MGSVSTQLKDTREYLCCLRFRWVPVWRRKVSESFNSEQNSVKQFGDRGVRVLSSIHHRYLEHFDQSCCLLLWGFHAVSCHATGVECNISTSFVCLFIDLWLYLFCFELGQDSFSFTFPAVEFRKLGNARRSMSNFWGYRTTLLTSKNERFPNLRVTFVSLLFFCQSILINI